MGDEWARGYAEGWRNALAAAAGFVNARGFVELSTGTTGQRVAVPLGDAIEALPVPAEVEEGE